MNIKMAGADSNLEDSFVEDKIIDVLPGCGSSPAGKQSCPSNNQVYEFLKSFIHLDSDSGLCCGKIQRTVCWQK